GDRVDAGSDAARLQLRAKRAVPPGGESRDRQHRDVHRRRRDRQANAYGCEDGGPTARVHSVRNDLISRWRTIKVRPYRVGSAKSSPPKKAYAAISVTIRLKAWPPRNAAAGLPPPVLTTLLSDVSSPIDTNAIANSTVRMSLTRPRVAATVASFNANEKSSDASRKPNTNFGKRSQMSPTLAPCLPPSWRMAHQMVRKNAANPMSAFCDSFTTTAALRPALPSNSPAATTAALVSSVPPSHAPATTDDIPIAFAASGISTIIGIATSSTSDVTYDSFFLSPWIAPHVAIAAETPQI